MTPDGPFVDIGAAAPLLPPPVTGLARLAAAALGRTVTAWQRLHGGSKKGAFRLRLADGGSLVG